MMLCSMGKLSLATLKRSGPEKFNKYYDSELLAHTFPMLEIQNKRKNKE